MLSLNLEFDNKASGDPRSKYRYIGKEKEAKLVRVKLDFLYLRGFSALFCIFNYTSRDSFLALFVMCANFIEEA